MSNDAAPCGLYIGPGGSCRVVAGWKCENRSCVIDKDSQKELPNDTQKQ